ncbi:MAG: 2-phosphosulfolactate phosphatase, partial [Algoriphagus sp.]|nr:2-phosphosulfolactate phosphatase [Algoriphagus sp.]
ATIVDVARKISTTTTMVAALASGVKEILPFADLEECRAMQAEGYLIGGERNGLTAPGFEMGNSPVAYLSGEYEGRRLAMTTTNGTQAIEKSKGAAQILIGAFPNLQATVSYIQAQGLDVLVHCAGWKGRFNLEDSLYAGALVKSLESTHQADEDGALAMKSLFEREGHQLKSYLSKASHAKRLQNHGIESDIDFCLTLDLYQEVVKVDDRGFLVRI